MNQQVNRIKNYEQKLQFTLSKLEPQYRLPTENSLNNASQPGGVLRQSLNPHNNYISFLESIAPQSNKSQTLNRSLLNEQLEDLSQKKKEKLLPQIANTRSKSENKNQIDFNSSQNPQQSQKIQLQSLPQYNRQSSSKNQKRPKQYNFYALPSNVQTKNQNEFESTNSSNLWNELNHIPNQRYANTTKNVNSNKITLQNDQERLQQSREFNRSSTIDQPSSTTNKSRNYLTNLSIYNNAVNRLDTSSSQQLNQPLSKQMINIRNIVKNQSLAPVSYSSNHTRIQDLSLPSNEKASTAHLRFSNECFSTPHKNADNSRTQLNKSYDYDLRVRQQPLLNRLSNNEKSIPTEQGDEQLNISLDNNLTIDNKKSILPNRNHLVSLNNSSNRYKKHNYVLNQSKLVYKNQQLRQFNPEYTLEYPPINSEQESNRSSEVEQSFYHGSLENNQYLIDERKVVNIQVQNSEMDQYIRQIQKYVFKKQHPADNNNSSSLSFKKSNVIHPSDLDLSSTNYLKMKTSHSQNQQLGQYYNEDNFRNNQVNSNKNINEKGYQNDIYIEQPLNIQQNRQHQQQMNLQNSKEDKQNQNLIQMQKEQIHQSIQIEENELQNHIQNNQEIRSKQNDKDQSKRSSQSEDTKDQFYQVDKQYEKSVDMQRRSAMNESLTRQYSFSVCYDDKDDSQPQSRGSEQVDQTPKLKSTAQSQQQTQKGSIVESPGRREEDDQINQLESDKDFFEKKRSAEFGISQKLSRNSSNSNKVNSEQQLTNKKIQLEILQEESQISSQKKSQQNSIKDLLKQEAQSETNQINSQDEFINSKQLYQDSINHISSAQQTSPKQLSSNDSPTSQKEKQITKQFPVQNNSNNIEITVNQISLPISQLESHQTASLISSKKSSISQHFQQENYTSNTLRRDSSSKNNISNPSQIVMMGSGQASSQNSSKQIKNEKESQQILDHLNKQNFIEIQQYQQQDYPKQYKLLNSQPQYNQFYEKERRKQKRLIYQPQQYKIQDNPYHDEEDQFDSRSTNSKNVQRERSPQQTKVAVKFNKKNGDYEQDYKPENNTRNIKIETLATTGIEDEDNLSRQNASSYDQLGRTDSKDSSQWLRENIIVNNDSPTIPQANSTQKSFRSSKSRSKKSTQLSFPNPNFVNVGGSSEEPYSVVKQYSQFKKQGFIKQNYQETQFVSIQKKNLTPKKNSINQINFSPSNDMYIVQKQISPNYNGKKQLANSSEISFQSPHKFNS